MQNFSNTALVLCFQHWSQGGHFHLMSFQSESLNVLISLLFDRFPDTG
jgi:hypothetical protein